MLTNHTLTLHPADGAVCTQRGKAIGAGGHNDSGGASSASHRGTPPLPYDQTPERTGWPRAVQLDAEARRKRATVSQVRRTRSAKGEQQQQEQWQPGGPDTTGNSGFGRPARRPTSVRPRPLRARLGGGRRVKGVGRLRLLRLPTAASAGWTRPARRSPQRSGHLRTLASGPPAPRQIFAPSQAIAIWAPAPGRGQRPRPRLRQAGPPRGQAAQAQRTRPSTRPGRKDFNQERALSESGKLPIDREEGSPRQAPQGAGQAPAGGGRVINGPVT